MGASDSKYMSSSDLSSSVSSESEPESDPVTENVETVKPTEETDAAMRKTVSLPKAQNVLTIDKVVRIEENLSSQEIVSLIYLLNDDDKNIYYFYQQLNLMLLGGSKSILSKWANINSKTDEKWQNKIIEALAIIKNYYILRTLGFEKSSVIDHFLPNNVHTLHLNPLKKCLYLICDNFGSKETSLFLQLMKDKFNKKGLIYEDIKSEYLEMYFLKWEMEKHLDLKEIKQILKFMNEPKLEHMLENFVNQRDQNSSQSEESYRTSQGNFENFSTTSFEIPQNSDFLREAVLNHGAPNKPGKSGTSLDHNVPRTDASNENYFLEYQYDIPFHHTEYKNIYPVDQNKPGVVLIINQLNFYVEFRSEYQKLLPPPDQRKFPERTGSERDAERLKDVFEKFGFAVIEKKSIDHLEMKKCIMDVTNQITDESSLFVIILSHGDQGIVYGSNSCMVKVDDIKEIMGTKNIKNLVGKPKILILQACQGRTCQVLETVGDESERSCNITTDGPQPDYRDMFTFWATIPGYAAIRNRETGSWFIQAFCDEILLHSDKQHFADICTRVKSKVAQQIWNENPRNKLGMTPIHDSTLLKDFYFPKRLTN